MSIKLPAVDLDKQKRSFPLPTDVEARPFSGGRHDPIDEIESSMRRVADDAIRDMPPSARMEELDIQSVARWVNSLNVMALLKICQAVTDGEGYKEEWPNDVELMVRLARWAKSELNPKEKSIEDTPPMQ